MGLKKTLLIIRGLWREKAQLKLIAKSHFLFLKLAAFLAAFSMVTSGCKVVAKKSIRGVSGITAKTVKATGKMTGKLTVATVKTSGKIILAASKTSASVLIKLAKNGEVTFVNAATGLVSSIPFVDGMSLRLALSAAKLDPRYKIFEIIRPSGVIRVGWSQFTSLGGSKLKSSDVIRVMSLAINRK